MRARLFDHFEEWVEQYRDDPLREDAFTRAERVYHLLKSVTPVEDDGRPTGVSAIPPDSLLREFIGGSCYEY
jgi:uridine kinase